MHIFNVQKVYLSKTFTLQWEEFLNKSFSILPKIDPKTKRITPSYHLSPTDHHTWFLQKINWSVYSSFLKHKLLYVIFPAHWKQLSIAQGFIDTDFLSPKVRGFLQLTLCLEISRSPDIIGSVKTSMKNVITRD